MKVLSRRRQLQMHEACVDLKLRAVEPWMKLMEQALAAIEGLFDT